MRKNSWSSLSLIVAVGLLPLGGAGAALIEPCRSGLIDVCLSNGCPGTRMCIGGLISVCLPPTEQCDGTDDDCDGSVDEDFAGLGAACSVGEGGCARDGMVVCDATGEGVTCGAVAGAPAVESCNGVDDDCDGATDEDDAGAALTEPCYEGPEGTEGVGACVGGTRTCAGGAFGACEGQVTPSDEVCDVIDDDCDGVTFEDDCNSCAGIRAAKPTAEDGDYTLYAEGDVEQPLTVYCHDMAGEPREYLTLVELGPERNFSQYTAGGPAPGTDVRTHFERVRLDIDSLVVDGADKTFTASTGQLFHSQNPVTEMPYATAMACDQGRAIGAANVDLRGTPLAVVGEPCVGGFAPFGSTLWSELDQVVDIEGGGFCGWASVTNCAFLPERGGDGATLQLRYDAALAAP